MDRDIWSESILWSNLLGLVIPIIVVCLVAVAAGRWARSPAPTVVEPPKPLKSLTFRVDEIPANHVGEFDRNLQSIAERDAALRGAAFTRRSLEHSDKANLCATITVTTTLSGKDLCSRLAKAGNGFPYSYSCDFDGITPLYEDINGAAVDIIAVPGLGSHPLGSWKSPCSDDVWLRDFLPKDVPNIRVLIYGYDTTLPGSRSKQSIEDLGGILVERLVAFRARDGTTRRPLIFIGHSLGGLLIKEALIHARRRRDGAVADLAKACYALLFFGVPNLGLRNEQLRTMVRGQPNEALMHDLLVDNDSEASNFLKRLAEQFSESCKDHYRVMSFFERMLSPTIQLDAEGNWRKTGPASLMVSPKSATATGLVAVADEDNIALNADHSGIVKFSSRGQGDYPTVRIRVMDCVERAKLDVPERFVEYSFEHVDSKKVRACMRSLAFEEIDGRRNGIDAADVGTCQWLLSHETLTAWTRQHRGLVWIKGKPGAGKSTLMKFALEKVPPLYGMQPLVLSFFFHGGSHELQRSLLGLFRSLLHQLLNYVPGALSDLIDTFDHNQETIGEVGVDWQWYIPMLQGFFRSALLKILEQRPVLVFIDALDECGEEPAVELIDFLKRILSELSSEGSQFSICFSCRHYPIIELDSGSTILIDQENGGDIDAYVRARLLSEQDLDIQSLLSRRAQGVFLWVHIVVNRVLQMKRNGESTAQIKREIERVPQKLDDLYYDLLQGLDPKDRPRTLRLSQWVCFSIRPLTTDELPWAMTIDPDNPDQTLEDCKRSDEFISKDDVVKRVTSLSCGLAEVASSKKSHVIQFIHQSVRDFFIERGLSALDDILRAAGSVAPTVNCRLFFQCIGYFKMAISSQTEDFYEEAEGFPFLEYAVEALVSHIKRGEPAEMYAKDILDAFCWPSSSLVDRLMQAGNHFEIWPFWPRSGLGLVHIASIYDLQKLLQILIELNEEGINVKDGDCQTPLHFAALNGHKGVVKMLLDTRMVELNARGCRGRTPLHFAALSGHEGVVKMLLDTGIVKLNEADDDGSTPLHFAALSGHKGVIKILLDIGMVELNVRDSSGRTPLYLAAESGHEGVVKMLLTTGKADVDSRDTCGQTPLSWAAENGKEAVVKMLLATGKVNVNSRDIDGQTPLSLATWSGHKGVFKMLLATGKVDVDSKDTVSGRTPLSYAAEDGHEGVVKMLLATGKVNVNSRDAYSQTPLSLAAWSGHEGVVKMLLATGKVDVNSRDAYSQTPLSLAAWSGHEGVVKMLLATGKVDVDSKDTVSGRTPLSYAAEDGHEGVVKMLLDAEGVEINARGNCWQTPLFWAAGNGHVEVVKLLCNQHTIDVNLIDNRGFTPLEWAMQKGHMDVVSIIRRRQRSTRH